MAGSGWHAPAQPTPRAILADSAVPLGLRTMDHPLRQRWDDVCTRVGAFKHAHESDLTFEMLSTMYAHPPRAYHNLDHIRQCLEMYDSVRGLADDRDCVEFALWLHDCVFFPERSDNEDRSADAAAMIAGLLGCPAEFTLKVRELIGVTRHHESPTRGDPALVADIDLSILGQPWAVYDAYRRAIHHEYDWAGTELFRQGRMAFLRRMLDKPAIYATQYFKRELEDAARDNMQRELDEWERGRTTP
jgi:predicted metal-dependent HD superfamily phosphohydrolase